MSDQASTRIMTEEIRVLEDLDIPAKILKLRCFNLIKLVKNKANQVGCTKVIELVSHGIYSIMAELELLQNIYANCYLNFLSCVSVLFL